MIRRSAVRALRTTIQTFVASLLAFPVAQSVTDILVAGELWLVSLYVAVFAGLVSFLQNVAEGLTGEPIPKG